MANTEGVTCAMTRGTEYTTSGMWELQKQKYFDVLRWRVQNSADIGSAEPEYRICATLPRIVSSFGNLSNDVLSGEC